MAGIKAASSQPNHCFIKCFKLNYYIIVTFYYLKNKINKINLTAVFSF